MTDPVEDEVTGTEPLPYDPDAHVEDSNEEH
jgi:hypothetical protein